MAMPIPIRLWLISNCPVPFQSHYHLSYFFASNYSFGLPLVSFKLQGTEGENDYGLLCWDGAGESQVLIRLIFLCSNFFFNRELGYHKREVYCLLSHVLEAIFTSTPRFNHHYNNQLKILTQQKNKKLSPHSEYHGTTISTSLWRVWFHLALRKKVSTFN